jgi:hypothetical protein
MRRRGSLRNGRIAVAMVAAACITLLAAGSGGATDGFTPVAASVVVGAGAGSVAVPESIHLDPLPAKADVLLALDTTGSMGGATGALGTAQADATAIVNSLSTDFAASGGTVKFALAHFQDYYQPVPSTLFSQTATDSPYVLDQALTDSASVIQAKVDAIQPGDGGDLPESYFRVFFEASKFAWEQNAKRFLIVLGDQTGHDPAQSSTYPDCPNSSPVDPGDGASGPLSATTAISALTGANVTLSFVSYSTQFGVPAACHAELAAPTGGGDAVAGSTTSLATQIESLVQAAARQIGSLDVTRTTSPGGDAPDPGANPASWVHVTGLPATANTDNPITFSATVAAPETAKPGTYAVDLGVTADGVSRAATQQLSIVVRTPLSDLSVSATPTAVGAGIDQVKLTDVPNGTLSFLSGSTTSSPVGSTPVGSTPVGSTPVGSTPVGSTPVGSTPVGSTPVGSTPVGSTPVGSTGLFDAPVGSTPVGSTPLSSVLLSQIDLSGTTWDAILCGTLAGQPLSALTLADLPNGNCSSTETSLDRFKALALKQVDLSTTLLRSVRWASLLMGNTRLDDLQGGYGAWCDPLTGLIPQNGGSCAGTSVDTSVLQMDLAGRLGSAPVGSTPVGSTPVGSTPVGSTPVGSTDIAASRLATIPLSAIVPIDPVVNCGGAFDCATKTLGDAYQANAIKPSAKFSDIAAAMAASNITINDIVVAVLGAAGLPWELLPIQGLQPLSATKSPVTYTVSATVDCSVLNPGGDATPQPFLFKVQLPDGFFPVDDSAKLTLNGGTPASAGAPQVLGTTAAAAAKLNTYSWPLNCAGSLPATTAALTFKAYAGLQLGTFTSDAKATTGTFTISSGGAPVTVEQNLEPNNDPSTAITIKPDTLVAGHIAFTGDQDFYQVDLSGLPRGTKVSTFLKVPSGTDFDLTVSKPATQSFFTTPVGSTPVGSTPIEDTGIGFSTSGVTLPSETLQDIPVGSTPVGSTPVGSTPVGSTSTTRGDVNEAAQIITTGEGGVATIGVSGYNGATSTEPYVLRVQETPPPSLPGTCPGRAIAVSSADVGTLPTSLPTSTKTLFIVDKQRLLAMYDRSAVNQLFTNLGTLAARPEVAGTVLQVDGNAAVRAAYAKWDATGGPCDVNLANGVVRSINDVVASYRNSATGLPNLHYIVLVGSDEALPMARTPDPVTLSPEENAAADLAFTTNGLTTGNALYASAAENNILTDGAYGAFTSIPWLGHDLLLPQLSVSRLVETPSDVSGQINRYLGNGGIAAPQSGVGTLNPTSAVVTGYDFLADGATSVRDNLHTVFPGLTTTDTFGSGNPAINNPLAASPWTKDDVLTGFLNSAAPAAIGSLNAHYNHYELEAADLHSLATTSDVSAAPVVANRYAARILFTMGCHGGLNVADTLGGSGGKYLDWAQLYGSNQAAMYIANTGFGYGDSASVALSERLLSLFAKNLHSDANSVGEEWAATLQQYFATAGAYDVYDEKVMEETTFYGLPFWHFSTAAPTTATFTPLATSTDPVTSTQSATVSFPSATALTQSQFGLYRPTLPIVSQEVTSSSLPARGLWIKSLLTTDLAPTAKIGMPTIDLSAHEPKPNVQPIFFPASPFTLEHSVVFGKQRDYANISDQFRPGTSTSTQRHVMAASLQVFYSNVADRVAPLISQVTVTYDGTSANVRARVTDDSGTVAEAAALVNDGSWHYLQLTRSAQDPTLFAGSIASAVNPEVFVEATDGANVSYSANKGSNFTSTPAGTPAPPQILMLAPTGPYGPGQPVTATYQCVPAAVAVAQCTGTVASGSPIDTASFGPHTFVVEALDANGNLLGSAQRTYYVQYPFKGFFAPVNSEPVLNTAKAGSAIPVKFSLTGNQGLDVFVDPSYPKSQMIACDASAPADGIESTVTAGNSSLSYDGSSDQYTYVWKTDSSWTGTCRALVLKMKDGTVHRALFKFAK